MFQQGLHQFTWRTDESADFIENANALVCVDLHYNLDVVQTNCNEIAGITLNWSEGVLDIFAARDHNRSYTIEELSITQTYIKLTLSYHLKCTISIFSILLFAI